MHTSEITDTLIKNSCLVPDITQGVEGFQDIYEAKLSSFRIGRISNLDKCIKLRSLDLSCNFISKIEGLNTLHQLSELKLSYNQITKLENLEKLKQLETLMLQANSISRIEGLQYIARITTLRLNGNQINKIENLESLKNLTELHLGFNKITKIEGISHLRLLRELQLNNNTISHIDGIAGLTGLQELDISYNPIQEYSPLKTLTKIQVLKLNGNGIKSIHVLPQLKSLTELYIHHNEISSLSKLSVLVPNLEVLDISHNKITQAEDLKNIRELRYLAELFVAGNQISNDRGHRFSVISKVPSVEVLDSLEVSEADKQERPQTPGGSRPSTPGSTQKPPPMRPMSARESTLFLIRFSFSKDIYLVSSYSGVLDAQGMHNYFFKLKQHMQFERERFVEDLQRVKYVLQTRVSEIRKQMEEERKMDIDDLLGLPSLDIQMISSASSSQVDYGEDPEFTDDAFVTQSIIADDIKDDL